MVRPTTLWPWRTSSAATVELSTPPLIATAMGVGSGMDGDPAKVLHRSGEAIHQSVYLFGRVVAAERKAHGRAGAVGIQADRGKDMRRSDRARRAGGAGGHGKSA